MQHYIKFGKKLEVKEWQVIDASLWPEFPKQSDYSSCGIFVCLYIRQILMKKQLNQSSLGQDQSIRKFIANEVLQVCYFGQRQDFGLKEVMLMKDLDEIIVPIISADETSVGPKQFARHQSFLKDPLNFGNEMFVNFGREFVTEKTVTQIESYLLRRYFGSRRKDPNKMFSPKCYFFKGKEDVEINDKLQQGMLLGPSYVQNVLVKEIIIHLVSQLLQTDYMESEKMCKSTEISAVRYKRAKKYEK